ncbi:hypothetical protein JWS13_17615 [Rhodococcus pseudokoreensis]|uniref:Uncharacterized protein n=1 Tax=Rhodococcus pseudokoreensis TaxID=2811421 RepID=A0A974W309_9NOCA|nr:hypothetical protein [Rhodococcus pseudokoreensis]QSE90308.1 hypothetical protein JWS13_17615 [Rhodococcus pseudokoreensis]
MRDTFSEAFRLASLAADINEDSGQSALVEAVNELDVEQLRPIIFAQAHLAAMLTSEIANNHDLPGEHPEILANVAHGLQTTARQP